MHRGFLSFVVFAAGMVVASAQSVGMHFTPGTFLLAPTDQPGVVAGANWNNLIGGIGNGAPLLDNSGVVSGAQVSWSATGAYDGFSGAGTPNMATNTLYHAGLYGNGGAQEVQVSIFNIPYASYTVYVYASEDSLDSNTLSITDGLTTYYYAGNGLANSTATSLLQTTSTDPSNPTVGPAQYQVFTGLSGPIFNLTTAGSVAGTISNNVFGVQIVNNPVPEPQSTALIALLLGVGAVLATRALRS